MSFAPCVLSRIFHLRVLNYLPQWVLLVTFLGGCGAQAGCKNATPSAPPAPTPTPTPAPPPSSPPVFSVPIVDLSLLNDFLPFGFSDGAGHLNPAYELRTAGDTTMVRAAGPGTVVNVMTNPESDFEVHVRPPDAADYLVVYDHLVALQVAVGQSVAAGQVLGRIGNYLPGVGRTELQINRGSGQDAAARCPREFGTAEFNASHDTAFRRFPGRGASVCLVDSLKP